MENGSTFTTYIAYGLVCAFLLLVVLIFLRTTMLAATLLFMPVARAVRSLIPGRKARETLLDESGRDSAR
jgi:hypothetical protein